MFKNALGICLPALAAMVPSAGADVLYFTGFESPFTVGNLNGQQNWIADAGSIINIAGRPRTGSQCVQMTNTQIGTSGKWAWESTHRLDAAALSVHPIVRASVWTGMVGSSGTRVVTAGLDLYDFNVVRVGKIAIGSDGSVSVTNALGEIVNPSHPPVSITTYHELAVEVNYANGTVRFFIDGSMVHVGAHTSTDFGDADLAATRGTSGAGGPTAVKFDDYTIEQLPLTCPADLNGDGMVDDSDFGMFVIGYQMLLCSDPAMPGWCPADLDRDELVDDSDFQIFGQAYDVLVCP